MSRTQAAARGLGMAAALGAAAAAWLACHADAAEKPAAPAPAASIGTTVDESALGTLMLSESAARRLGIETTRVVAARIARSRRYGGQLTWAPAAAPPRDGSAAYALLSTLVPADLLRMADLQIAADGALASARIQAEASRRTLGWAEDRLAARAGSQRELEDARTQARLADAALGNAQERRALLGPPVLGSQTSGALWVRVPVYAGDADRLRGAREVRVFGLGEASGAPGRAAHAVTTRVAAAPGAASADLLFELKDRDPAWQAGERVSVAIPLGVEHDALVVPWSAVLHDVHGGTWVYREVAERRFERRRVEVEDVEGGRAVLASGVEHGMAIVTAGATELFGTELGFAK
ncbi:MAG TPA: hypothetical protein VII72_02455 [Myxococcota bacterium]